MDTRQHPNSQHLLYVNEALRNKENLLNVNVNQETSDVNKKAVIVSKWD